MSDVKQNQEPVTQTLVAVTESVTARGSRPLHVSLEPLSGF